MELEGHELGEQPKLGGDGGEVVGVNGKPGEGGGQAHGGGDPALKEILLGKEG